MALGDLCVVPSQTVIRSCPGSDRDPRRTQVGWVQHALGGKLMIFRDESVQGFQVYEPVGELGRPRRGQVVLTHFHEDHAGGATEISTWGEATVLAHRPDDTPADRHHHLLARHPAPARGAGPGRRRGRVTDRPPPVPDQLLRRLAEDRDAARARVERLTAELADARHHLERLEITHQMLLELAGAAGPPLPPAYRDILDVLADHPPTAYAPKTSPSPSASPPPARTPFEGIRAKLKRLVGRDLAQEPEAGLFTIKRDNT
jgi:hypothetical protein